MTKQSINTIFLTEYLNEMNTNDTIKIVLDDGKEVVLKKTSQLPWYKTIGRDKLLFAGLCIVNLICVFLLV